MQKSANRIRSGDESSPAGGQWPPLHPQDVEFSKSKGLLHHFATAPFLQRSELNRDYSAFSLGSRMFSRIATIAAGTMPEPPKISLTAWGAKFRMAVFAPMP